MWRALAGAARRALGAMAGAGAGAEQVAALARCAAAEEAFRTSVSCRIAAGKVAVLLRLDGQQFAFDRTADEPALKTLERIAKNQKLQQALLGPGCKAAKPKFVKGQPPPPDPVLLHFELQDAEGGGLPLDGVSNAEGWGRAASVRVSPSDTALALTAAQPAAGAPRGGYSGSPAAAAPPAAAADGPERRGWDFPVFVDPPTCVSAAVEGQPLVGVPQHATLELSGCTEAETQWWADPADGKGEGELLCVGHRCEPPASAAARRLRITVLPRRGDAVGAPVSAASKQPIAISELREAWFPPPPPEGALRVVTWNVLWDGAMQDFATGKSLYPYCDPAVLEPARRRQLLLRSLLRFRPHLACLQELGASTHAQFLEPALRHEGLCTNLAMKADPPTAEGKAEGKSRDGVGVVWDEERLELVSVQRVRLSGHLAERPAGGGGSGPAGGASAAAAEGLALPPGLGDLERWLREHQHAAEILSKCTTVGQVVVLRERRGAAAGAHWVVANTHLWFHPHGGHIRAIQLAVLLAHADEARRALPATHAAHVVLCGDLNILPGSAPWQLLTDGCLPADHAVWAHAQQFQFCRWDFEGEAAEAQETAPEGVDADGVELRLPFPLRDATPAAGPTNVTPRFSGRLDYIFVGDSLDVAGAHPPPPPGELQAEGGGLPSALCPSDHAPVAADLAPRC
eukprot:TRINITY_DN13179_c0_g1_i1.p1 TRINITY_DN13179_c0_g1~~TRINITY_DN13179_c0_g1_i1.p1  ORF type:complete len:686 (+),score=181.65 TRINITY_DN13179_c0_g1_i1:38-2095(+)